MPSLECRAIHIKLGIGLEFSKTCMLVALNGGFGFCTWPCKSINMFKHELQEINMFKIALQHELQEINMFKIVLGVGT